MKATLAEEIEKRLAQVRDGYCSLYIKVKRNDDDDDSVVIRIANHQGKKINNHGSECISFITSRDNIAGGFQGQGIKEEHLMDEDNYNEDFQDIETILEWADLDPNTTEYCIQK